MLRQLLFKSDGVQATGVLPGAYLFPYAGTLAHALLQIRPPSAGVVTLALEIAGELAEVDGERVELAVGTDPTKALTVQDIVVKKTAGLAGLAVPAGALVRWRVVDFTAPPEDGPLPTAITLAYLSDGIAQEFLLDDELTVRWVDGLERLALFDYDRDTHAFTETLESEGLSAARATIATNSGASVVIAIEGQTALRVVDGKLEVAALEALGGVATIEGPRLEFLVNGQRIATLTKDGVLRVSRVVEAEPEAADNKFSFYSASALTVALGAKWLELTGVEIV